VLATSDGASVNPTRATQVLALALAAAIVAGCVSGCARRSANAALQQTPAQASATTTGTSAPDSARGIQLPQVAATTTLEPPADYAGFQSLPSFTYHHIDRKVTNEIAITPATFEAQLKILKALGYQTVTARDVVAHQQDGTPLPPKPVMITFDDGWRNQYVNAWPLLRKYGFKATFFINPQPISAGYSGYMTRDQIAALAQGGNDIESHTWRHLRLTRTRNENAARFQAKSLSELTRANSWIKSVVDTAPVALCYPFGLYDLEAIGLAKAVGYEAGFCTDEGVADARAWDAFAMKRFTIFSYDTIASFKRRLLSAPLPVTDIQPPPGSRIVGTVATLTVDISAAPSSLGALKLTAGPSMRSVQIVEQGGRRYALAQINGGKTGFREISMKAAGPDGTMYYASWGIETGDKP
jgi:peptidoglycan/xylan/chitin deacetylase (PgdA/CDA1 family)